MLPFADALNVREWWQLPSGRTVEIRSIEGQGQHAEATVRYISENGSRHVQDFSLRVAFILRGRRIEHVTG